MSKNKFEQTLFAAGYTQLTPYVNTKVKVRVCCAAGHEYETTPCNFTRGYRCAICSGVKVKTGKVRAQEAIQVHGDKYEYPAWYAESEVAAKTKLPVYCKACAKTWETTVDNHVRGRGCPNCRSRIKELNKIQGSALAMNRKYDRMLGYLKIAKEHHQGKYEYHLVDMFGDVKSPHTIVCPKHGKFDQVFYNHSVRSAKCHQCNVDASVYPENPHTRSPSSVLSQLKEKLPEYKFHIPDTYKNAKSKIRATCDEHGDWWASVDSFMQGSGCPACKGHSQRYVYINDVSDGYCLKYGIARNHDIRINSQNSKNKLQMTKMFVWEFSNYGDCRLCESVIKRCVSPVVSPTDMVDGWTETAHINQLEVIINIIEEHGGVKV